MIKYKEIWSEIKNIKKRKKIDSDQVLGDIDNKYLKTKVEPYIKKITTHFHDKAPKEELMCLCLSAKVIDTFFKLG